MHALWLSWHIMKSLVLGLSMILFWYLTANGILFPQDPNAGYVDNLAPLPKKNVVANYTINGSSEFEARIENAISELRRHGASNELINKAGHMTINEDRFPCFPPISQGCSFIEERRIQIMNHHSKKMNIVLLHEITHIALNTANECRVVRAELDFMRGNYRYDDYILQRAELAC